MNKTSSSTGSSGMMRGAGSSNSSSNSGGSSSNANNYYGFSTTTSANNNNDNEINGGGLSFVIHSSTSPHNNNNHHHQQLQQQQNNLPSISSVGSSTSSGISSGSSTITKSSTFNGNTFTRSKPKERKPLPNAWSSQEIEDHHQHHQAADATSSSVAAGPFLVKGKGIIPSVTLSEATPSPKSSSSKKRQEISFSSPTSSAPTAAAVDNEDLYYFDTSNSNSSGGGSVILAAGRNKSSSTSFSPCSNNSGACAVDRTSSSSNDHSMFQPRACSTFILTEGEEFPEQQENSRVGGGDGSSAIINKNVGRNKNGIRKMKVDVDKQFGFGEETQRSASASMVTKDGNNSTSSGSGGSSNNNSSSSDSNGNSDDSPTNGDGGILNGIASNIQFVTSGEEESFECFGDGSESFTFQESSTSGSGEASLQYSRDGADLELLSSSGPGAGGGSTTPLSRNSWTRTSLRKSPQNSNNSAAGDAMGYRRWGSFRNPPGTKRTPPVVTSSNALANQLYRSSSFHSSGRSSAGDAEEMYSDGSLEDEVLDLTHKVHHLEEKMNVLAENQNDADDRYTREKEKNAELSTKVFMLEEQLRETELRGDEKLKEEQRRFKEFQSRWDREKQLQSENYEIRLHSMEKDLNSAKTEGQRVKGQLERERGDKENLGEKLFEMERELLQLREENRLLLEEGRRDREQMAVERQGSQQTMLELKRELESLRQYQMQNSPSSLRSLRHGAGSGEEGMMSLEEELMHGQELKGRVKECEEEIRKLKRLNKQLQEANDELNAQLLNRGLEEGRTLLTTINSVPAGDSLAAEFEAMSQDQTALGLYADSEMDLAKVKKALKEQIEVNEQLRSYIDGILLIIVENNPQLLEVKNNNHNCSTASPNSGSSSNRSSTSSSTSTTNNSNSKTSIANPNCSVAAAPNSPTAATGEQSNNNSSSVNFRNGFAKISFSKK